MPNIQIATCHRTSEDFHSYELVKLKDWKGADGEHLLTHAFLMDTMRKLMGRALTIIDASISGTQNKAMKDLVRQAFSDEMSFAADWAFDQNKLMAMVPDDIDPETLGTVTVEEALGVK